MTQQLRLPWGLVGGGKSSQIGLTHRIAAQVDQAFTLTAAALDIDPVKAQSFGSALGLDADRSYGGWQDMLKAEAKRADRPKLVTIATPNATHFAIAKAFLEAGFHVLIEKPITLTVEEAQELVSLAAKTRQICAVNYGYTGYPMVRQMRSMVAEGQLGHIRIVVAEFAGGFMADAANDQNPRVRWRFDPAQAGVSAISIDAGIHALHMACYVTGQTITSVLSDFVSGVKGRQLEDDSLTAFRMSKGTAGRAWASGLAIGRSHGLTIQVFGEQGGLRWAQEQPNQLFWTPLNQATQILERGASDLSAAAQRASRIPIGHPEGMPTSFANIYRDLEEVIRHRDTDGKPNPLALDYPSARDGLHTLAVIHAMVQSANNNSQWTDVKA